MKKNKTITNSKESFLLPETYFENFQQNILKKTKIEEINQKHINLGFTTPQNYHENIASKLLKESKTKPIIPLFSKKKKYVFFAAASIVLCFILFNTNRNKLLPTTITSSSIDSTHIHKQKTEEQFIITEKDVNMLALFIEDEQVDEYLDELIFEDLAYEE